MATKKKEYKVKIKDKMFYGISHGLKFESGVSEKFDNEELYTRLLAKGYEDASAELKKDEANA